MNRPDHSICQRPEGRALLVATILGAAGCGVPGGPKEPPMTMACGGGVLNTGRSSWSIPSGGRQRSATLYIPASYDNHSPWPLIFNFHGFTSTSGQQEVYTAMDTKADASHFIMVYPDGINNSWNGGACCGDAASQNIDDVGFTRDLIDNISQRLCIDPSRIFATGMSNGGFFTHRLGCELADRIAAVAPVSGVEALPSCTPSRPMPIIHFHGTADLLVPFGGNSALKFPSVPDTFAGWAMRDGCTDMPAEIFRQGDAHCSSYRACAAGSEVVLCTIENGGHTWPGALPIPQGNTSKDLSANDAMWTFFQAHPLK